MIESLSIVLPVHDESRNVGPLARELDHVLAPLGSHEIIFVDDASNDGAAEAGR